MLSLLLFFLLFGGELGQAADARPGITFGFAIDGSGPVVSSGLGEDVGRYLESQLSVPVKVRSFAAEDQLYNWLVRFREVDVAWFSKESLYLFPAGQIYPLVESRKHTPDSRDSVLVARHELNDDLRQQIRDVFLAMQESTDGRGVLSRLGAAPFVSLADGGEIEKKASGVEESAAAAAVLSSVTPASKKDPGAHELSAVLPVSVAREGLPTEPPLAQPLRAADERAESSEPADSTLESVKAAPIALVADSLEYNSAEDSYEAKGDVVLHQGELELKAEELLWQAATQDAAARGSVELNDAGTEVSGERLQYNLATGQGQIHDGRVFVREGNFHLSGDQIEKHGQASYLVKQGSFTTCDGDIPDWKFSASEVDVTLGGYAKAKNVWFHIKEVPVLYTPYLLFPVKTERESGLLMPMFGYSNNKGARASLAWYQVIDRNMDATVYLDYLSEIGLGKGLEYRYALANQNNGKALYYHVNGFQETPDLSYLEWAHSGVLPGNWRLTADVEYTDKKLFFEEFGDVAEDYNRDKTVSTLMLRQHWQKLNLVGHGRYIKDLEGNNDSVLQRLPELSLGAARYRLADTPYYVGLESYATRFWSEGGHDDGERLYLKPSFSAVYKPGSWLEIVPQVALYERLYSADADDGESFVPELSLSLTTRLVKSFDTSLWGLDRVQHSVEPKITYSYVPDEYQGELPYFDGLDRIERQNNVSYVLVNRLTGRSLAEDGSLVYRDLFNLKISQSYNIDEARNNRSGANQPFSDVLVEVDFQPTNQISFDAKSQVPIYGATRFHRLSAGVKVSDDDGNAAAAKYFYKEEDFGEVAADYAGIQLSTSILQPVYVKFEERYDFSENRQLEQAFGLEYRSKCWSLLLTYRNRYRDNGDDDQEVLLSFVLAGLGQNFGSRGEFSSLH